MGLAASQGRMLLLTARKSDLEFRAQQISQKRLILAQQLEEISTEYETATSNRQMKIKLYSTDANGAAKTDTTLNLTYKRLISGAVGKAGSGINKSKGAGTDTADAYETLIPYRLVDASGAIVVSDKGEIPDADNYTQGADGLWRKKNDANAQVYKVDGNLKTSTKLNQNNTVEEPNYLQDCLRYGKYLIQQGVVDEDAEEGAEGGINVWKNVTWDGISFIQDSYYQEDDDVAKAKYDRLQAQVQAQDKKLELELDNVETQRNAVQTEMDSVDKVMEENIEKTFNAFG